MYSFNSVRRAIIAFAGKCLSADEGLLLKRGTILSALGIMLLLLCFSAVSEPAVNVYAPSDALQKAFIADTTTQYRANVTPGFFSNTFNINLLSRNLIVCGGTMPCELDKDIASIVSVSTWSYVYGWANGEQYERFKNIKAIVGWQTLCDSTSSWKVYGSTQVLQSGSTWQMVTVSTWNYVTVDSVTCPIITGNINSDLYTQNYSTPTIIPGF